MRENKDMEHKNKVKSYFKTLMLELGNIDKKNFINVVKSRIKLVIIIILGIFLFVGYEVGISKNSEDLVLKKLEDSLKEGSISKLSKIVKVDNNRVNKDKLQPLIDYYKLYSTRITQEIKSIKENGNNSIFELKKKSGLFGTDYYLNIKTYSIKFESNFDNGVFTIENYGDIDSKSKIDGIIPGNYTVEGTLKSEWADDIKTSKNILVLSDEDVEIDFNAINISINTENDDAKVYINDKYSGLNARDAKDIGPFPTDGSAYIYIRNEFPWGNIDSKKTYIYDVPNINININMVNDELESEIKDSAIKFYSSVFESLNQQDSSLIENATDTAKEKIYDVLEEEYLFFSNLYSIEDVFIDNSKSEYFCKDGKYYGNVVIKLEYTTKKKWFGFYENNNSKMFLTSFVYEDNGWKVYAVEKFELDREETDIDELDEE